MVPFWVALVAFFLGVAACVALVLWYGPCGSDFSGDEG